MINYLKRIFGLRTDEDQKLDYLYHVVVAMARHQAIDPTILKMRVEEQAENLEYAKKMIPTNITNQ